MSFQCNKQTDELALESRNEKNSERGKGMGWLLNATALLLKAQKRIKEFYYAAMKNILYFDRWLWL